MLLLPGADIWNNPKHGALLKKASRFLSLGAHVCAICWATAALPKNPGMNFSTGEPKHFFALMQTLQSGNVLHYEDLCTLL